MLRDVPGDGAGEPHDVDEGGLEDVREWAAMGGGLLLVVLGLLRGTWLGWVAAALGAALVYRKAKDEGLLDEGSLKRRALHTMAHHDVEIERSIVVEKPVAEVYGFWRTLGNLPRFMQLVDSVIVLDETHTRWAGRVPGLGVHVHWLAETTRERENELLAWRSLPGSELHNEGTVRFAEADDGRHTKVTAHVLWRAPGGKVGARILRFLVEIPENVLEEDLLRMKQILEDGAPAEGTVVEVHNREA